MNHAAVWSAIIIRWYKLNVDASFEVAEFKAWVGTMLRCYKGEVVFCAYRCYTGITSALKDELMAILFGLQVIKQEGVRA